MSLFRETITWHKRSLKGSAQDCKNCTPPTNTTLGFVSNFNNINTSKYTFATKTQISQKKDTMKVCKILTEEKYKQIGICFTNYLISPEIKF